MNTALFAVYVAFAALLLLLRPHAHIWLWLIFYTVAVCEAVAAGCIAWLAYSPNAEGFQTAMFALQVGA